MEKGTAGLAAGLVLVGALAGGVFLYLRADATQQVETSQPVEPPAPSIFRGEGNLRAENVLSLEAPVDGIVETIAVEPGQEVMEGQLLVALRSRTLEMSRDVAVVELQRAESRAGNLEAALSGARLEAARTRAAAGRAKEALDAAEKAWKRQEMLHREGATPRLVYESAEKDYQNAAREHNSLEEFARQAEERVAGLVRDIDEARAIVRDRNDALESANQQVRQAEIHAPGDGFVVAVNAREGDEVQENTPDMVLLTPSLSLLEVVAPVPPDMRPRITPGMPSVVTVAEIGYGLDGVVKSVTDGTVVVEFANPSPNVRPGMTAVVQIELK
jgi:multidrug resistance efflux pump